jgi:hypothetical protein
MATITRWVLGKDTTSLTIEAVTVANDGSLTFASAVNLFGLLQQVRILQRSNEENISPMDRPFENNVDVELATDMEVTELMRYTAGRLLRALAQATRYVRVTVTHAGQVMTYYGKFSTNDETLAKGANTGTAMLKMVDANVPNPVWV